MAISVSLVVRGVIAGAHWGSPLLLILVGEPQLGGEGAPKYWADVVVVMVGEVLEEHRPIDRGDPLEEAVIHSAARPSGGPGAAE